MIKVIRSQLETEQKFFDRNKAGYLKKFPGRVVLIKDNKLIGIYDTTEKAYEEGLRQFGNVPMFIKELRKEEPVSFMMHLA